MSFVGLGRVRVTRVVCVCICAVALLLSSALIPVAFSQTDTISLLKRYPDSFITRNGASLQIEGHTVRFAGPNIYWLGLDENGSPGIAYPTAFRVEDAIQTATLAMGATVIRAHTLGISQGQRGLSFEDTLAHFTATGIEHIDYAIYVARKYNVRLVIPFTDNYNYYHGGEVTFTQWRGTKNQSAFYASAQIVGDFKQYISRLLNHVNNYTGLALKDDPTIMAWETGNELGKPGTTALPPSWTQTICEYVKSINAGKQLVLDGRQGINSEELGYDCVDVYSDHYYPMSINLVNSDQQAVHRANKVFFAGEFGWNAGGSPLSQFLDGMADGTTNMDCFWSLFPHNDSYGFEYHNDGHSLYYPGQAANGLEAKVDLLRTHAYQMAGFATADIPAYAICGAPVVTNVKCDHANDCRASRTVFWRGGYGCAYYEMERNNVNGNGNDPNWQAITKAGDTNVNDFNGFFQDANAIASNVASVYYRVRGANKGNQYGAFSAAKEYRF